MVDVNEELHDIEIMNAKDAMVDKIIEDEKQNSNHPEELRRLADHLYKLRAILAKRPGATQITGIHTVGLKSDLFLDEKEYCSCNGVSELCWFGLRFV